MLVTEIIIFIAALAVLVKASDYFVDSAARLARLLSISEFIIGFTLVAVGTSLPELVSSIAASLYKNSGLVIGNIAGSNIANIGLIVGIAAIIKPLEIAKRIYSKEGLYLLFVSVLFFVLSLNHKFSRIEGIILLALFIAYSIVLLEVDILKGRMRRFVKRMFETGLINSIRNHSKGHKNRKNTIRGKKRRRAIISQVLIMLVSSLAMYLSARFLIPAAQNIASGLGVPASAIGVTILAMGTSLPELVVAITSVRKGFGNMLIGTILGSNIANILLIIGVSAVISPLAISTLALYYYMPIMLIMVLLLLAFIRTYWLVRMLEGFLFLFIYVAFLVVLLFLI